MSTTEIQQTIHDKLAALRPLHFKHDHPPIQNAQRVYDDKLSSLDRLAVRITEKIGSVGFFMSILAWTILWCGFNIVASMVPALHWKPFDPFPAFVAYLLISNVIQILLMPLIMVGQNLQGKYADTRAQLDFEVNQKAEKEIMVVLSHLELNTNLLIQLMGHLECRISDEEMRALGAERELAKELSRADTRTTGQQPEAPAA